MPQYEITLPGQGKFRVSSDSALTDQEVYAEAMRQIRRESSQAPVAPPAPLVVAPSPKRTAGEAFTDIGAGIVGGIGSLIQVPGQLAKLVPGMFGVGEAIQKPGEFISSLGESFKSEGLRVREAMRSKAISQAEKDGILAEFLTAIKETVKDPALFSTFIAEQLPLLAGPLAAARVAQVGAAGATRAATAGLTGEAAAKAAADVAARYGTRGTRAAIGAGATMQGADIASDTYETAFKAAKEKGLTDEAAQSAALNAARLAGLGAGAISVGTQFIPGARAIEERLAGVKAGRGRIAGALGEATSEGLEEAGGAFAQNLAIQQLIDEQQSLTKGVGTAAGLGVIGGGVLGGVFAQAKTKPEETDREKAERLFKEINAAQQQAVNQEKPLAITWGSSDPIMAFADGSTGRMSEIEAYIKSLPENEQVGARAKLFGKGDVMFPASVYGVLSEDDLNNAGIFSGTKLHDSLLGLNIANDPETAIDILEAAKKDQPEKMEERIDFLISNIGGLAGIDPWVDPEAPAVIPKPDLIKIAAQPDGYVQLEQYKQQLLSLPKSAENTAAINEVKDLQNQLTTEQIQRQAPAAMVIDDKAIRQLGFAKSDNPNSIYQNIVNKDLANPEEFAYVNSFLQDYISKPDVVEATRQKVQTFLADINALPTPLPAAGVQYAGEPIQPSGGAGPEVAVKPGAGAPSGRPAAAKPSRVVSPVKAAERPVGGEGAAPAPVAPKGPTPLQQREAFGKAIGAVQPYRGTLMGRKNLPAEKAAQAGDFQGVVNALEKSKSVTVAEVARKAKDLGTKIAIDEDAAETYTRESPVMRQISIDGAKMHLEALQKIRELAPKVDALPDGADLFSLGKDAPAQQTIGAFEGGESKGQISIGRIAENGNSMFAPLPTGPIKLRTKEDFKALQKAFEDVTQEVGEDALRLTSIGSAEMQAVAGVYDAKSDTIRVSSYAAKQEAVLAHEIVHAQTIKELAKPSAKNRPAVKRLEKLHQHVKAKLEEKAKTDEFFRMPYGIESLSEFVAEGMSNPRFQFELNQIEYKSRTAWDAFTQGIADLLGIKKNTAFTELLGIYGQLTAPPPPKAVKAPQPKKPPSAIMGSELLARVDRNGGLSPSLMSEFSFRVETKRKTARGRPVAVWRNPLTPNGRLFRVGGKDDYVEIAEMLEFDGYLEPGTVEADYKEAGERAKDLIKKALSREEVLTVEEQIAEDARRQEEFDREDQARMEEAEELQRQGQYPELDPISAAYAEQDRRELIEELGFDPNEINNLEDDDLPFDLAEITDEADFVTGMRERGYSDEQIQEVLDGREEEAVAAKAPEAKPEEAEEAAKPGKAAPRAVKPKAALKERQAVIEAARQREEEAAPKPELTKEIEAKIDELGVVLRRMLSKMGLGNVALEIVKDLKDANGEYANGLIKLALNAQSPVRDLRHESIHALKGLGFFTDKQWATLEKMAREKWVDQFLKSRQVVVDGKTMSRYDAYMERYNNEDIVIEEAIADAFGDFDLTKPPPGFLRAIHERIKQFFRELGSAMGMTGLESAEDIFRKIEKGELKAAKPAEVVAPKASLRAPEGKEFKQWFGDSKVVDDNGKPLVVYHGMTRELEGGAFRMIGDGAFFTDSSSMASRYADAEGGNVVPVYLSLKNPAPWSVMSRGLSRAQMMEMGYDGFIETVGYGENKRRIFVVFSPEQIKSAVSNVGAYSPKSADIRYSLRAPEGKELKQWFGKSKITNLDGSPRVMYHGTGKDYKIFTTERRQAKAIFLADSPDFAEKFAKDTFAKAAAEAAKGVGVSEAEYKAGVDKAIAAIRKDYGSRPEGKAMIAGVRAGYNEANAEAQEYMRNAFKDIVPTGPNIMPVYVRAENPFDFDNKDHIDQLKKYEEENRYTDKSISNSIGPISRGDWEEIESRRVQAAIKSLGFDGFYVKEGGIKSLAVYSPDQIKSAIGNVGAYGQRPITKEEAARLGMTEEEAKEAQKAGDIRFSLRDALGMYSELESKIAQGSNKAPAASWKAYINGLTQKGVKPEEIEWSGVRDWLDLQKGTVTKDDLINYLKQGGVKVEEVVLGARAPWRERLDLLETRGVGNLNANEREELSNLRDRFDREGPTPEPEEAQAKYGQYTLPGGENYREVLLKLPVVPHENNKYIYVDPTTGEPSRAPGAVRRENPNYGPDTNYKSRHWDQPNVIAHIRLNDRTDADGNKVLFVEELQSDWGQEGKKRGFAAQPNEARVQEINARLRQLAKADMENDPEWDALTKEKEALTKPGIPAAPFVTKTEGWLNLALKRIMVMAAEGGYDKVAFVNGEQSADRYDLSKHIGKLSYDDKFRELTTYGMDGSVLDERLIPLDQVDDVVGKEVAQKLADTEPVNGKRTLEGLDLRVGGEGMKTFYDQIVPMAVKKLLPKVGGGQLQAVGIHNTLKGRDVVAAQLPDNHLWGVYDRHQGRWLDNNDQFVSDPEDAGAYSERAAKSAAAAIMKEAGETLTQSGFDVTPDMKQKVTTTGLPRFSLRDVAWRDVAWSKDRIDSLVNQFGYTDGRTYGIAAYVNPNDFVIATTPGRERADQIRAEAGKLNQKKLAEETQTPFLEWDIEKNIIIGHEGRHRMAALADAGVKEAPVVLWVKDRYGYKKPDTYTPKSGATIAGQRFESGKGGSIGVTNLIPLSYKYNKQLNDEFGGEAGIKYSLREVPVKQNIRVTDPDIAARLEDTITPRKEEGFAKRMMSAIAPKSASHFRAAALNRYNYLSEIDKKKVELMGGKRLFADASAEAAALKSDLAAGLTASAFGVHDRKGGAPVYVRNFVVEVNHQQVGGTYDTRQKAEAAAKQAGGIVRERGHTIISNKDGTIKGPLAIFAPLAAKFQIDPKIYEKYQFWAGVKRGSRFMEVRQPDGSIAVLEKNFDKSDIPLANRILAENPEFEQIQKEWIAYNDELVKFLVDTGVLNASKAKEMIKHGDYIPFYRQIDEEGDAVGPKIFQSIGAVKPPKKLKHGEAPLGDFLENIVRNSQSAIHAGIKNIAARRAADIGMDVGVVDKAPPGATMKFNQFTVLEDGVPVAYETADQLFVDAVKSLHLPDLPFIGLLSGPANLLRNLVTKDPAFMLANMMRDSLQAWAISGLDMKPMVSTLANFGKAIAGKDPVYEKLLNAGLLGGYEYAEGVKVGAKKFGKELRKEAKAMTPAEKAMRPATYVWEALEKGTTASDAATRMEVFKKTLEETGNEAEALFRAMEVMNFNRKGSSAVVRILTAAVPFLNARMQGLDVLYRAALAPSVGKMYGVEPSEYQKRIQKTFFVRGMTMIALSCMYWAMTHDDDEYKRQEQETRDNYWLIPSMGIKIPIPFEVGVMFKVIPERIMEYSFGNDTGKDFMKAMGRNLWGTLGFNPIPQAVLPVVESISNYSFFTGRAIVGQGMDGVAPEFQVTPGTSKLATALGSATGLSPMKIDALLKGYTGTIGTYASDLMDAIFDLGADAPKASKRFEQMPFFKRFAIDPQARGQVTAYYDLKNEVDQIVRTSNYLEKTMDFKNWGEYMQDNMKMLAVRSYVLDMEKTMKQFREMKNLINISTTMTGDQKKDMLEGILEQENLLTSNIRQLRKMMSQ